jgi:hypothetical protein
MEHIKALINVSITAGVWGVMIVMLYVAGMVTEKDPVVVSTAGLNFVLILAWVDIFTRKVL